MKFSENKHCSGRVDNVKYNQSAFVTAQNDVTDSLCCLAAEQAGQFFSVAKLGDAKWLIVDQRYRADQSA